MANMKLKKMVLEIVDNQLKAYASEPKGGPVIKEKKV